MSGLLGLGEWRGSYYFGNDDLGGTGTLRAKIIGKILSFLDQVRNNASVLSSSAARFSVCETAR